MATRTMDLSKYRDLDIKGVTMRGVNGNDSLDAASRCVPPDGGNLDGNLFMMLLRQQIIAQAIISYTRLSGEEVKTTGVACLESLNWSGRTREFIGALFDHLNGVTSDEREDFQKALMSTRGSDDIVSAE